MERVTQGNAIHRAVIDYIAEQSTMVGATQENTITRQGLASTRAVRDRIVGQSVGATGPIQVNTIPRTIIDRIVGQSIIATGITSIKINAPIRAVRDRIIGQSIIATGTPQDDAILGAIIKRITRQCTMVGIVQTKTHIRAVINRIVGQSTIVRKRLTNARVAVIDSIVGKSTIGATHANATNNIIDRIVG